MRDKISDSEFHLLSGVGHAMHIEKRKAFLDVVNRYLDSEDV